MVISEEELILSYLWRTTHTHAEMGSRGEQRVARGKEREGGWDDGGEENETQNSEGKWVREAGR